MSKNKVNILGEKCYHLVEIISPKYGYAFGESRCHPDDYDFVSDIMGGELAYKRAQINYNKLKINKIKTEKLNYLYKLKSIARYDVKKADSFNAVLYFLNKQIKKTEREIRTIEKANKNIQAEINSMIAEREINQKKMKDYLQKKEFYKNHSKKITDEKGNMKPLNEICDDIHEDLKGKNN